MPMHLELVLERLLLVQLEFVTERVVPMQIGNSVSRNCDFAASDNALVHDRQGNQVLPTREIVVAMSPFTVRN